VAKRRRELISPPEFLFVRIASSTFAHSVLTSANKPVPTAPYSPGGGTPAHSLLLHTWWWVRSSSSSKIPFWLFSLVLCVSRSLILPMKPSISAHTSSAKIWRPYLRWQKMKSGTSKA
jgi:hypothetical protein